MKKEDFINQVNDLNTSGEVYVSPDFQCDQTGGYPTSLCANWEQKKAWLQLNPFVATEGIDAAPFEQYCADWGIRSCKSTEEFNALLEGLGEEAYENASLRTEEESEVMQL